MGFKLAILYSQINQNKPFTVISAHNGVGATYKMKLNIKEDVPIMVEPPKLVAVHPSKHGLAINLSTIGDLRIGQIHIKEYLKYTSMACPYAKIQLIINGVNYEYNPGFERVPKPSQIMKVHPQGTDVEMLKRFIAQSPNLNLREFLMANFQRVSDASADNFLIMNKANPLTKISALSEAALIALKDRMTSYQYWSPPDVNCLSPIGNEALSTGVQKYFQTEAILYSSAKGVYNANPYLLEVLVARKKWAPFELIRIANRIPLLFDASADVATLVTDQDIDWANYGLPSDKKQLPILVVFHMASTHVPFKTAGKEYIADIPELRRDLKLCIQSCLRKIETFESEQKRQVDLAVKKERYNSYLPLAYTYAKKALGESPRVDVQGEIEKWMQ
jgi:DNA topoisomerase-6 subunit B